MLIGLIDVDNRHKLNKCFPNLPLMKLSAWHKTNGDLVEWYDAQNHYDIVYMSKVFSFTPDYTEHINADKIIKGGTGYTISLQNGKELFNAESHSELPKEIEHIFPDYSIYDATDTAYGFMSRGCPRNCGFCIVGKKEGLQSYKVANLSDFWNGQKFIELLDPNTLACKDWENILIQIAESKACINFNQGLDIRFLTKEKLALLQKINIKHIHFAFDRYDQKRLLEKKLNLFRETTNYQRDKVSVYVLCNFDTTIEQDLERIMFIRSLNFNPYVMRYDKANIKRGSIINKLARWVNNRHFFWKYETFTEYLEAYDRGETF